MRGEEEKRRAVADVHTYLLSFDQKGSKKDQIVRRQRSIDIQLRRK